jgi:bifunctional DNase/RNase
MTLMRIREIATCPQHKRTIIILEDVHQCLRLTFYADPDEACRLTQELERGPYVCHPVYDFIRRLLDALQATATRVVLDIVQGEGLDGLIYIQQAESERGIPCYASDALALALRANIPIYATAEALAYAERLSLSPSMFDASREVRQWLEQVRPEDFSSCIDEEDRGLRRRAEGS